MSGGTVVVSATMGSTLPARPWAGGMLTWDDGSFWDDGDGWAD